MTQQAPRPGAADAGRGARLWQSWNHGGDFHAHATDPKTGAARALLVHYHGLGLGVRTDSGWRIRLARVYPAVA